MNCEQARPLFSAYLDGDLTGKQMHAISDHLAECAACGADYASLRETHRLVASIGRKQAPAELALQLRVALSRELAARRRRSFEAWSVRLENAFHAIMVPATAGVLSAIIIFGLLIGFFSLPAQLEASDDVPTVLYTPPVLASSPFDLGLVPVNTDAVVVEAYVDANGRVQDYRILSSAQDSQTLLPHIKNMLIFTVFRPATAFGRPTTGRAVLSFSKINVKG